MFQLDILEQRNYRPENLDSLEKLERRHRQNGFVAGLKRKVKAEKALCMEILRDLLVIESEKIYASRGLSSLHQFAIKELKYSGCEASYRINAARLLKLAPTLEGHLAADRLTLTHASSTYTQVKKENQRRKKLKLVPLSAHELQALLESLCGTSTREAEKILARTFPDIQKKMKEKTKRLDEHHTMIQLVAHDAFMACAEELKGYWAHKNFDGRWDELFFEAMKQCLRQVKADRAKQSAPRKSRLAPEQRSRYISKAIRRAAFARAQNQCEYQDPETGFRCESRHALELDHITPFSAAGEHTIGNVRVLCSCHNKFVYDEYLTSRLQ